MNARRASGPTQPTTWKDPRRRQELLKSIGAAAGVVLLTALIIFLIRPGDSPATPSPSGVQTPVQTVPGDPTATSLPPDTTVTTTPGTVPGGSTDTSVPTTATTTPPQP